MVQNILQISDCHLVVDGAILIGVDTQASLQAVLQQALAEQIPDAIVASGDIAHDPLPDVYTRFLRTVRECFDGPLLCLPGNHDVRGMMEAAQLPMQPLSLDGWALIPLDSHEDELPRALVTQAEQAQVIQSMQKIDTSTTPHMLLATHHPLVQVDCPWLDCDRIQGAEKLLSGLIEGSGERLRGVIFGHAHQVVEDSCAGLPVFGVPSTCFQFKPRSETFAIDDISPGYRWLRLHDDGIITSEVQRVNSFAIHAKIDQVKIAPPADSH